MTVVDRVGPTSRRPTRGGGGGAAPSAWSAGSAGSDDRRVRRRPPGAGVAADLALLGVALAAGLGAARLIADPGRAGLLLPMAAAVAGGHVATSASRRLRAPAPAPVAWGVVAVALTTVWTLLPGTTWHGIPTLASLTELAGHLRQANDLISSHSTPLPPTSSVTLLFTVVAGLVAVGARSLWAMQESDPRWRARPMVSLVPTLGLFCYSALLSSERQRLVGAFSYLGAALLFVVVADASRLGRWTSPGWWRTVATGVVAAATALAAALGVATSSSAVSGIHLHAFTAAPVGHRFEPNDTGSGQIPPPIGALDLIDNLLSVETDQVDTLVFTATSPRSTYWQVATLDVFDGNRWLPDARTAAVAGVPTSSASGIPPMLPTPTGRRHFTTHIAITAWGSSLLPAPPGTDSVSGPDGIHAQRGLGVEATTGILSHVTFRARAPVPTDPAADPGDETLPAARLAPYLALPPIDPAVRALARQIVAGASTPAAQATALQQYFTSGAFRYTLVPPALSPVDPLAQFLFETKAGFCQQFAGAFAVLARSVGLPTRVAVGFTPGLPGSGDRYRVTGADAHVWPQVYLGPSAGWVPFEPTPGDGTGVGADPGPQAATPTTPTSSTTTTVPAGSRFHAQQPSGHLHDRSPGRSNGLGTTALIAVIGALAVVAAAVSGGWLGWRRRTRRRHAGDRLPPGNDGAVLASWQHAVAALARAGVGRRDAETLEEHLDRLASGAGLPDGAAPDGAAPDGGGGGDRGVGAGATAGPGTGPGSAVGDRAGTAVEAYRELVALAMVASYAPQSCTDDDVRRAAELAASVRRDVGRGAPALTGSTRPGL